jgi:hypothetical protein
MYTMDSDILTKKTRCKTTRSMIVMSGFRVHDCLGLASNIVLTNKFGMSTI